MAFVTLDLLYFGKEYVRQVRSHFDFFISFTASHTHSGPWASEVLATELAEGITCDPEYTAGLVGKLTDLIERASRNTFEAQTACETGVCGARQGVGGNRREKGGVCDPSVNVLAVREKDGPVRAVLVGYALHPTCLHEDNLLVSADYPCYIRRSLSFSAPEAAVLFAQGASGNQSTRYFRFAQDFTEAARIGTAIGLEAGRLVDAARFSEPERFGFASCETELPIRDFPPPEEAEKALRAAEADYEAARGGEYLNAWNAELRLFGAQNTLEFSRLAQRGYVSPETPTEIEAVVLGDAVIVGVQAEMFVEYALKLKELSGAAKTFVFSITNGAAPGYLITPEASARGGYEAGTTMFSPRAGKVMLEAAEKIIMEARKNADV